MTIKLFQVDAFTSEPFAGNPAGVCILEKTAPENWMRQIASEMNLSETAFLFPENDGYNLRWFTPVVEVDLCGHATLASAHIMWERGLLSQQEEARFSTRSGLLKARNLNKGIELDFPANPPTEVNPPDGLLSALGIEKALYVGRSRFDYLVEIDSAERVRKLKPDFGRILPLPVRGVIVTAASDLPEYDFISRFFAPAAGVNEDPVTGSAHCALTPYWSMKLSKTEMRAYQASARGGELTVQLSGERVLLTGQAITVFEIEIL